MMSVPAARARKQPRWRGASHIREDDWMLGQPGPPPQQVRRGLLGAAPAQRCRRRIIIRLLLSVNQQKLIQPQCFLHRAPRAMSWAPVHGATNAGGERRAAAPPNPCYATPRQPAPPPALRSGLRTWCMMGTGVLRSRKGAWLPGAAGELPELLKRRRRRGGGAVAGRGLNQASARMAAAERDGLSASSRNAAGAWRWRALGVRRRRRDTITARTLILLVLLVTFT